MLPDKLKQLHVTIGRDRAGSLTRESQYAYAYARDDARQPAVSLLMPPTTLVYTDGDLFPAMDMNLPEGFLFQQILERHAKQTLTKMHLLALMGDNGIGRVGFAFEGESRQVRAAPVSRKTLLGSTAGAKLFAQLVDAYLSVSAGVSGVQPKIMLPSRAMVPIPDLIVKIAGDDYPGLAANEYLCLDAARRANIPVSGFDLSADGTILVIDRFDVTAQGQRLGFEDIAALMGRQVHDRLSNRKYEGSYERMAEAIRIFSSRPADDLERFFEQLALSVMVRNGDAHLKNFGMLYTETADVRLAPMYDVVTTTIYKYQRPGGAEAIDRTLALKLRAGRHGSRGYPNPDELLAFGREVCGVRRPREVLERIAQAMGETLAAATSDSRFKKKLLRALSAEWEDGQALAS
ncbi:MAG TPA: type II toxin-antitoxin system HipA family toxin [Burkholderiaceae bacterium]|nr:type II toxin-antitoxin system HipA family toxin [Burkholderiaceae bacterium]